jgi:sugar phosphate isomerase/epimerase
MEIGIQFYTLRDYCKDLNSFSETLKRVRDIGYKNVQISGVCEFSAEWLKEELLKNDLRCVITHTAPDKLQNETEKVANDHSVFGCDYIGLGYYAFQEENGYDNFYKTYHPVAEKINAFGKYFMYHNHAHEFSKENGKLLIERIAEDFSPEILGITLDTFWVQAGGGDPAEWLEILKGRVPCIHLKDFAYSREKKDKMMAPIGEGNINFDRVFKKALEAGTKFMLVEQDDCNGEDPFDCIKRSYEFLKSRGF